MHNHQKAAKQLTFGLCLGAGAEGAAFRPPGAAQPASAEHENSIYSMEHSVAINGTQRVVFSVRGGCRARTAFTLSTRESKKLTLSLSATLSGPGPADTTVRRSKDTLLGASSHGICRPSCKLALFRGEKVELFGAHLVLTGKM
jgi:hypothetical protein